MALNKDVNKANVARNYRKLKDTSAFEGTPTENTGMDPWNLRGQTGNQAVDYNIQRSQEKEFTKSHSMEDVGDFGEKQRQKRYNWVVGK